jgi:hypothetical protein
VGSSKAAPAGAARRLALHTTRRSALDLEIGGDLAGLPGGSVRYVTRKDLLALPQVSYAVTNDPNFTPPTQVSGVPLEELRRAAGAGPGADMIVAICRDQYRANHPPSYIAAHQPLLVLKVNGQPPAGWPEDSETHSNDMGPYLISHPKFEPSFNTLAHVEEAEIPWGVVRLDFRDENEVFAAIAPHGPHASDPSVRAGYEIAQQNFFRCHNSAGEGGQKAGVPWKVLATFATASPEGFARYLRDPRQSDARAQIPANPGYDGETLDALVAYFQNFASAERQ